MVTALRRLFTPLVTLICLALLAATSFSAGPAEAAAPVRIMNFGDSLTHGSSGDYTWRYFLYKNFEPGQVDFVGPRSDLNNMYTHNSDDTSDHTYVDPHFDQDHAAKAGRTLADGVDMISPLSDTYHPDVINILLGINDISLNGAPSDVDARMRTIIQRSRSANPNIRIAIGLLLPQVGLSDNASWESRRLESNQRFRDIAANMSTASSPIAIAETTAGFAIPDDVWDGVHLNAKGEVKIASAFASADASLGVGRPMSSLPTPAPQPLPQAPTLTASAGDGMVTISWNRPANAFNFVIEVEHPGIGWSKFPIAMNTLSWPVKDLVNGATYHFRITPVGMSGSGPSSNIATATPTGPAPAATTLSATVSNGSTITVNWSPVAHQTGAFVWTRDLTGDKEWKKSAWSIFNGWAPFVMPGILKGADYEIKIQSSNGLIPGGFSNTVSLHTTGPAPGEPSLRASAPGSNSTNGNYTDLTWSAPANANAYYVQIRDATWGEEWKQSSLPTWDTSFRAGMMMEGHQYQFRIVAHNDYIPGNPSNTVTVDIPRSESGSTGDHNKANAENAFTTLTAEQKQHIRDAVHLAQEMDSAHWNDPSSFAYRGLEERVKQIVFGSPSLRQLLSPIAPTLVATVIALAGFAFCPESAALGCVFAVNIMASVIGECVGGGCNDKSRMFLAAVIGGVGGARFSVDDVLLDIPASAPLLARKGVTGRVTPYNPAEYDAMFSARVHPGGHPLSLTMNDSRWPASAGWEKWEQTIGGVTIHYVRNKLTGEVDDFKFKD